MGFPEGAEEGSKTLTLEGSSGSRGWTSFDLNAISEWEKKTPETESGSSVNGPAHTEATASSSYQTSGDPTRDSEALLQKREELHLLVREQFRHYCERGLPKWQLSSSSRQTIIYNECAHYIIADLEISPTVKEYQKWIQHLHQEPETLFDLFKLYK